MLAKTLVLFINFKVKLELDLYDVLFENYIKESIPKQGICIYIRDFSSNASDFDEKGEGSIVTFYQLCRYDYFPLKWSGQNI